MKALDLTGQEFNRLKVLQLAGRNRFGQRLWKCVCSCGSETITTATKIKTGYTKSCGCYQTERARQVRTIHGRHGTVEYVMWKNAKSRAQRENVPFSIDLEDIQIPKKCPLLGTSLKSASKFFSPESPSLDRLYPDKGYIKGNVWVISHKANTIKSNASITELKNLVNNLENRINGQPSN